MYRRFVKRPADTVAASLILLILLPLGLITYALIRIMSGTPVIFRQQRTGLGGDNFTMFKYRTMTANNNVNDSATENQMTEIGKLVRALSLDEIPQLVNILKGEMSFIGPRPWIPEYYAAMTRRQRRRCDVLPGLTGLAQVKGRNSLNVHDKIEYDLHYVENISLREDMKIIVLTITAVLKKGSRQIEKSGIYQELQMLAQNEEG